MEGVTIDNRSFSDIPMTAKSRVALHLEEIAADKERGWKRSFRDKEPELAEDLMPELTRRYNGQKSLAQSRQLALRRRPMREAVRKLLEQRSRKKSRQRNERRRLGIKQKVAK